MSFEMARSRLEISLLYSKSKEEISFHKAVEIEFNLLLNAYKKITGYETLLERNKIIDSSIRFRNPFTDILNCAQSELLERYRSVRRQKCGIRQCHISSALIILLLQCRQLVKNKEFYCRSTHGSKKAKALTSNTVIA